VIIDEFVRRGTGGPQRSRREEEKKRRRAEEQKRGGGEQNDGVVPNRPTSSLSPSNHQKKGLFITKQNPSLLPIT